MTRPVDAMARAGASQERVELLASIVDSSDDAIISKTLDGIVTSWNRAAETMYGYTAAEMIGKPVSLLLPPGRTDENQRILGEIREGRRVLHHETTRLRKDGSIVTISLTVSPVHDADGTVIAASAIARDITDRKKAEATFEGLLQAAPDAMVGVRPDGTIAFVNHQAETLFGYDRDELLGRPVEMLVPMGVSDIHPGHRSEYFADPQVRPMGAGLDLSARRKDGVEFPAEISLSSIDTEEGLLVTAAVRDITDRRRIQAKFEGLLQAAPDAMVGVHRDGTIAFVNHQAEMLFGYERDELLGRPVEMLVPTGVSGIHPGHRAKYFADPQVRPMGAGLDLAARRRDGVEFPAEISLSSIETEEGLLVTAAVRDVTDRKRVEEQTRAASLYARSLIEASLDPLVTISPEGKITDVNEATIKVTGVLRERLIGTDFHDYFTEPDRAREAYRQVFSAGSVTDYPLTIRHREGDLTDVLYNASPYRDVGGNVRGVFAAARDITAQRQAEAEISERRVRELDRLAELERFQRLTVGRELKMIELKKDIERLRGLVRDGRDPE